MTATTRGRAPVLHHLALRVADLGRAEDFYVGLLGLPPRARHHHEDGTPRALSDRFFAFVRELEWALHYARAAGVRARVELALPHVSEVLELRDDLSQEATQSLGEQLPITENAPPPAPGIRLHDTLAEPADGDLSFGGHFDTTYFDTSLFDEAETEP